MTNLPVPFARKMRSASVVEVVITLAFNSMSSTYHWSSFELLSTIAAELAVTVP